MFSSLYSYTVWCGDVVLDSFFMALWDDDNILDQIYEKQIDSNLYQGYIIYIYNLLGPRPRLFRIIKYNIILVGAIIEINIQFGAKNKDIRQIIIYSKVCV